MLKSDLGVLFAMDLSMYGKVDFVINTGSSLFSVELPNIFGRLISPKFNSLFENDQNILQFNFFLDSNFLRKHQIADNTNQSEEEYVRGIFKKMIEALKGTEIEVTFGECEVIREISKSIGSNFEMTPPKVIISWYNFRYILNAYGTEESIEYAAENLERLSEDEVNRISPEMFEKVLKSKKLKVKSENSLFKIVSKFIESNGGECFGLLSLVELKLLGMRERIEYIRIVRRWAERNFLENELGKVLDSFERFVKGVIFIYFEDITSEAGIYVDITASSEDYSRSPVFNLEGFKEQNDDFECFISKSYENSWIQWDFHYNVIIQSYEIECRRDGDYGHLRNWRIEVSNNGNDWETVDERQNQTQLKMGTKTKYSVKTLKSARYLRLTQVGENYSNTYSLVVRNVKFGGF